MSSVETSILTICLLVSMVTDSFRQETKGQSERVVFDILCGDFNIDNLSPGKLIRSPDLKIYHEKLNNDIFSKWCNVNSHFNLPASNEPRQEKTGLRGFQPGQTQTGCATTEDILKFGGRK